MNHAEFRPWSACFLLRETLLLRSVVHKGPESLCQGRTGLEEPVLGQARYPAPPVYGGAAQKADNLSSSNNSC